MPPLIATFVYGFGIWLLFSLHRDRKSKTSRVLWLPVTSLLISGSRPLSFWLHMQPGTSPEQLLEGSPFDAVIALGLIVAGAAVLLDRRATVARLLRANLVVLPYLSYCAISVCWSDYPGVAFKRWIRLLGGFISVLIVLTDRDPPRALKWVLTRVGFVLIPISILLIKYYPDIARSYDPWTGIQYVSGVATDKNMLGMICLVYGLGALFQFLETFREQKGLQQRRRLVAQLAVLGMLFWLLSAADSMTSLSCFYMGSFLILVTRFVKIARKTAILHLLVASIVGASYGVLFLHIGQGAALEGMGRNPTLTGRTEIWTGLLQFTANPVFGAGFDSFWLGDRLNRIWASGGLLRGINEAHNGYLETYLNLGWIGVILLTILIVVGYRNVITAFRHDPEKGGLKLALFVVCIIYNFTEAGFRSGSSVWFAFFFAMLALPRKSDSHASGRVELKTAAFS
jgi:exopolysaccharide production protein ExoQ